MTTAPTTAAPTTAALIPVALMMLAPTTGLITVAPTTDPMAMVRVVPRPAAPTALDLMASTPMAPIPMGLEAGLLACRSNGWGGGAGCECRSDCSQ